MPFCGFVLKSPKPLPPQYPKELNTLGDYLRKKRLDLGLLQREVAEQIGVDESTINNWERQRTIAALPHMCRIAEFLSYIPYNPTEPLAERLRACRTVLGLSQREIAKVIGCDPKAVWEWETGLREPGRRSKQRITRFLRGPSGFR